MCSISIINIGNQVASPPDRPSTKIAFGPGIPAGLFHFVAIPIMWRRTRSVASDFSAPPLLHNIISSFGLRYGRGGYSNPNFGDRTCLISFLDRARCCGAINHNRIQSPGFTCHSLAAATSASDLAEAGSHTVPPDKQRRTVGGGRWSAPGCQWKILPTRRERKIRRHPGK